MKENGYSFKIIGDNPLQLFVQPNSLEKKLNPKSYNLTRLEMRKKIKNSQCDYDKIGDVVKERKEKLRDLSNKTDKLNYIGLGDVNSISGFFEIGEKKDFEESAPLYKSGDVLFARLRPNLNKTTWCPQYLDAITGSEEFVAIYPKKNNMDSYYLFAAIKSNIIYMQVKDVVGGSSLPRIDKGDFFNTLIPVPPSEIQKYIGDKIRKAEKLREEAKELKKETKEKFLGLLNIDLNKLKNDSKYHKINSDLVMNRLDPLYYQPKYTKLIRQIKEFSQGYNYLSEVLENTQIGKTPDDLYNRNNGYIPFVESSNISKNILKIDKNQRVSKEFIEDYDYKSAKDGDLLLAKDGATIGAVAMVPEFIDHVMGNGHTLRLRLKNKIYAGFLYYFLSSELGYMQLNRESTGSAQAGLKKSFAKNIIVPDVDEETAKYYFEVENERNRKIKKSKQLIEEAKQDVEDLIEGDLEIEN